MNDESTPLSKLLVSDRVALVTGAGRGIGRACARTLAHAGAHVVAVARTESDLDALRSECDAIETWVADVTEEAFYARVERLERLDVLVNNAGTNRPQDFVEVDPASLAAVLELNVTAMFRTAQAAVRVMLRNGCGGSVINMSSQMGHVGSPRRSVYCMTKHAVEGLTKAMAVELAAHGIRVNALAPTFIETAMTRPMLEDPEFSRFVERMIPLGHPGQPDDVALAALYLASPAAAMITGHSLRIDGGWTAA